MLDEGTQVLVHHKKVGKMGLVDKSSAIDISCEQDVIKEEVEAI